MSCVCVRARCVRACVDAHQHIVEVRAGVVPFGGRGVRGGGLIKSESREGAMVVIRQYFIYHHRQSPKRRLLLLNLPCTREGGKGGGRGARVIDAHETETSCQDQWPVVLCCVERVAHWRVVLCCIVRVAQLSSSSIATFLATHLLTCRTPPACIHTRAQWLERPMFRSHNAVGFVRHAHA